MTIIAIDFETANERPDSPCALGLAWVEDGAVTRREYRLVRPKELRFGYFQVRVHGIEAEDVADAPEFPDVIAEFLPDFGGATLLAHNAAFDMNVLCATLGAYQLAVPDSSYICSMAISRRCWPAEAKYDLRSCAERVGHRFAHHHAGEDADACARIAIAAMRDAGVSRIADFARAMSIPIGDLATVSAGQREQALGTQSAPATPRVPAQGPRFVMRGSTGSHYTVTVEQRDGALLPRCTCMAGRNRLRCRHVTALLDGDITDLVSGDPADLAIFRGEPKGVAVDRAAAAVRAPAPAPAHAVTRAPAVALARAAASPLAPIEFPVFGEPEEIESLAGMVVVFTGRLTHATRSEAEAEAARLGARTSDTVSPYTDLLIAGADPGVKLVRARALRIPVLSEDDWLALVRRLDAA